MVIRLVRVVMSREVSLWQSRLGCGRGMQFDKSVAVRKVVKCKKVECESDVRMRVRVSVREPGREEEESERMQNHAALAWLGGGGWQIDLQKERRGLSAFGHQESYRVEGFRDAVQCSSRVARNDTSLRLMTGGRNKPRRKKWYSRGTTIRRRRRRLVRETRHRHQGEKIQNKN